MRCCRPRRANLGAPLALPQVTIQEREDGQIHCRGLLKHPAATEEDALNLLFLVRPLYLHPLLSSLSRPQLTRDG